MFSGDAKDEIAGVHVRRTCCAAALLRGLALFAPNTSGRDRNQISVTSERASVARAVIAAAHAANINADILRPAARRYRTRFTIAMRAKGLNPLGASMPGARLPARLCCRRTYLRAAFLSCGSVSNPARGNHLEFFCRSDEAARQLCTLIAGFRIDAAIARRRGRPLVYVKQAEAVSALLGNMGANHAVLRLAGQRALKQTKNSIRRTVNSEAANAARAALSAARQRKAATRALATFGLSKMSKALREAAQLRIAYPARTLRELARAARPPITKAAMASRLRLLERMTER